MSAPRTPRAQGLAVGLLVGCWVALVWGAEPPTCRLSWTVEPPDADVAAFRLYRSPVPHGYQRPDYVAQLEAGPSAPRYTASCLQWGLTQDGTSYLAVTAVDRQGEESVFSDELRVEIKASAVEPPILQAERFLSPPSRLQRDSGNFDAAHPASRLLDGCTSDVATCKAGNVGVSSFWVELDLGGWYRLTRARLFGDAEGQWRTQSWRLDVRCTDTAPWAMTAPDVWSAEGSQWFEATLEGVTARYVRVTIDGLTTGTEARELEVYGVLTESCP